MDTDEKYMQRCLQLAKNGRGYTAPNPMVGAVVVHKGKIIGEGYHVRYGEKHAEVNALESVKEKEKLRESTIYVSLEPCSHYGKTPPCVELLLRSEIQKVVIGCLDPFPEVAGRGVGLLREAGVEVVVGVLEAECLALNRPFCLFYTRQRPYITLKWAQSADGFIDQKRECGDGKNPIQFSTALTQMLVHKRRAEHQAILVGTRTAQLDNPSLNVRYWCGNAPLRVVIDKEGILPRTLHLFDKDTPTLVVQDHNCPTHNYPEKVELLKLDFQMDILPQLLHELYRRNIQTLLVEGGTQTLQSFINTQFWDEIIVETVDIELKEGIKAPKISSSNTPQTNSYHASRFLHFTRL